MFAKRLQWMIVCARYSWRASRLNQVVVPVAFPAAQAVSVTTTGLMLAAPVNQLQVRRDVSTGLLFLQAVQAPLGEIVSDPAVQATLARSLDLLEACDVVRDDLPPVVKQAARRLHVAVTVQQAQAMRRSA